MGQPGILLMCLSIPFFQGSQYYWHGGSFKVLHVLNLLLLFHSFKSFFLQQRWLMVSHWSLCDSKSPQVSWTLLSILADLSSAVVWMVSACPLISKFSSPFTNLLGIVPSARITIGITVTFMFHVFSSLTRSWYLSIFSFSFNSFNYILWFIGTAKSTIRQNFF